MSIKITPPGEPVDVPTVAEMTAQKAALDVVDAALAAAIDRVGKSVVDVQNGLIASNARAAQTMADVEDLKARVTKLEKPPAPPPAPPPPPPPPPLPPPPDGVPVARVLVSADGIVRQGVAVPPALNIRTIAAVTLGGIPAQFDNPVFDRNGALRWFLLSAIAAAGDLVVTVLPTGDQEARTAIESPAPRTNITIDGKTIVLQATKRGDWRRGPIVTETVWDWPLVNGLVARVHESRWANGASSSAVLMENGRAVVDAVGGRTQIYAISLGRDAKSISWSAVAHTPFARYPSYLGDRPVFAQVVPLAGGGVWDHFKQTAAMQNQTTPVEFPTDAIDALPDTPFAVSNADTIGYAKRVQGQPGGDNEIGHYPAFLLAWLRNYTPATARAIRRQTDVRQAGPYFFRMAETDAFPRPDNGQDLYQGDLNKRDADDTAKPNQQWTPSHWPSTWRIPYLLWGELHDLEGQVAMLTVGWLDSFTAPGGSQMTRHPLYWPDYPPWWVGYTNTYIGDQGAKQLRTVAWGVRTQMQALASMPHDDERVRTLLGWDKCTLRAYVENAYSRALKVIVDATGPAPAEPIVQGWGKKDPNPHKFFDEGGIVFLPGFPSYKQWMACYVLVQTAVGMDLGEVPPDGDTWWRMQMRAPLAIVNLPIADADKASVLEIDHWPKIDGATMGGDGNVGVRPGASGQPIRTAEALYKNIVAGNFIGSTEADWFGNHYALATFAKVYALPGADAAIAWTRANIVPNHNHRIEPR